MTAIKHQLPTLPDGRIDLESWLQTAKKNHHLDNITLIQNAAKLAESASKGLTTFYGQSCLAQGLEMADIVLDLKLDQDAVAASIITSTLQHTRLPTEIVIQQLNDNVAKLANGVLEMNVINTLQNNPKKSRDQVQTDRLRKTFLAMVSDIRVVLIKLAEQMCIMRSIKNINPIERQRIAQETLDIYAPLANRLGIGQLKWELEDIAFHYTNPETYKSIAKFLAERRTDRENRINAMVLRIKDKLNKANITANITGRAKHIYSIYLKMQKKHLDLKDVYDVSAVRVLVDNLENCYTVLSIVHSLYDHIPQEFDDYIANPKPNGYRSIHTAVIDHDNKHLEVQIRTRAMHDEAEHGVAAHWIYKEGESKPQLSGYEAKITFLRQLLAWHKDLAQQESKPNQGFNEIFEDRVYAFTPAGDIIDLPTGATPLDFAYHIHTQLGHRCRGAKVNGNIVPLTHALRTGDRVDILTIQNGTPSRDWLSKDSGYLKTARARAKAAQWFNQQEIEQYINTAKQTLDREFARAGIQQMDLQKIAARLNFKNANAMLSSLGHGSLRTAQILHAAQTEQQQATAARTFTPHYQRKENTPSSGLEVAGINDLLTRIARCCKPIPGDTIIGYITQGRGVSIHRQDCNNMSHVKLDQNNRLIKVNWDSKHPGAYYVDLQIRAQGRENILKEITAILANFKIDLLSMNSIADKKSSDLTIKITVQIHNIEQLQQVINQINQLPQVNSVKRLAE
jgi:GTP pyrophosphokinase